MAYRASSSSLGDAVSATLGQRSSFGLDEPSRHSALEAIGKAQAWQDTAGGMLKSTVSGGLERGFDTAAWGLEAVASNKTHRAQLKAIERQKKSNRLGGIFNAIGSAVGIGVALCERRYKQNVSPLVAEEQQAWQVVRNLPLYSFSYKSRPDAVVYGPMVDEVEQLDGSLVRPTLFEPDDEGPVRGFDVMRHQAYESLALQQALRRIEELEARLNALEVAS